MSVSDELQRLGLDARAVLQTNDLGEWTKPAPALYPHQWNWDSAFIAIGLSHYRTERAMAEIRSLLRGQWKNGMVPQIVFNPSGTGYFPGPDVWQGSRSPEAPSGIETSGISQPPVLAIAALSVWRNAEDRNQGRLFLKEVYPSLLSYHRFFYEQRNPDGNGLVVVIHPWESGLDNSPPYLEAGGRVQLTYRPSYTRLDTLHVEASQRPTDRDYDMYIYLLEQMRDVNYDQHRYLKNAPLQVQDVLFNSILCRANVDLAEIADIIGENGAECLDWARITGKAVNEMLWSEGDSTYYSRDRVTGALLTEETVTAFGPLFGQIASQDRASQLIDVKLQNPHKYWPESGFPVATTALDSSWFKAETYWRGPVWFNTNWLVIQGLVAYGRRDLAGKLALHTLELALRSGFHEYYNPQTGEAYGTGQFSWSAALSVDLIAAINAGRLQ